MWRTLHLNLGSSQGNHHFQFEGHPLGPTHLNKEWVETYHLSLGTETQPHNSKSSKTPVSGSRRVQCFEKIRHRAPFTSFLGTKEHVIQKVMEPLKKKNQNSVQTTTFSMGHDSVNSCHTMPLACPSHSMRLQIPAQRKHHEGPWLPRYPWKPNCKNPQREKKFIKGFSGPLQFSSGLLPRFYWTRPDCFSTSP